MLKNKIKEERLKSLQLQLELFDTLRSRHLMWINDIENAEIAQVHLEIIDLIKQTKEKYYELREMYNKHG